MDFGIGLTELFVILAVVILAGIIYGRSRKRKIKSPLLAEASVIESRRSGKRESAKVPMGAGKPQAPSGSLASPEAGSTQNVPHTTPSGSQEAPGHIFLSYASADRSMAKAIADALSEHGWPIWWDRTIPPGKTFDQIIESALNRAACIIVLWSRESVLSDWVKTEASEGARRGILIPVLLQDVVIPLEFRRIQAASLADWQPSKSHEGFESLLRSVSEMRGLRKRGATPDRAF